MEMLKMDTFNKPKILLLGNGINREFGENAVSWSELLNSITTNHYVGTELDALALKNKKNNIKSPAVPFPLEIVLRTDDNIDVAIKNAKTKLYGNVNKDEQKELLRKLLSLGFDCILTTNYSYELEMAALNDGITLTDSRLSNMQTYSNPKKRAETKYLLHTYNSVEYNGIHNKIWHIHGEARKPNTIIIGHYYGNILFKYKELLGKRRNSYQHTQDKGYTYEIKSWLDAFVLGDVYILGLGMDFSEMDLWWLINRKKRESAEHGKIVFYEPATDSFDIKKKLLEDYDVTIRSLGYSGNETTKPDYKNFYRDAIPDIKEQLQT